MKTITSKRTLKDNYFLHIAKHHLQANNLWDDYSYQALIRIGRKANNNY